ncbi:MAG: peptidoglycan DD-metalloendopeptidase family protein [Anaerolineaceae bacterium]|nr:peptidoglycan DD-metalloendopeptidase family protein [Anaerolineaceae bacterium]
MKSPALIRIPFVFLIAGLLAFWPLQAGVAQEAGEGSLYIVQRGDTLFKIAATFGSSVEAFTEVNNLSNPSLIFVGQQLQVPLAPAPAAPAPLPSFIEPVLNVARGSVLTHRVSRGDSLSQIAAEFELALDDLVNHNEIENASLLHVGQIIEIPGLKPTYIDAPWPEPVTALQTGPAIMQEGQSARLLLQTSRPSQLSGNFLGNQLNFISDESGLTHWALMGVPLDTGAGYQTLAIDVDDGERLIGFQWPIEIHEGIFGREAIILPQDDLDTLDPETERVEQELLQHLVSGFRPGRWFDGLMLRPSVGRIVSRFGTLRSYNRGPYDRLHRGVDYAAPTGTEIRAVADGLVVLAADLNVRGLSVMIDHGLGVFSGYWHLSEMEAIIGDFVRAGESIGKMGNTGRSTGSHLHWQLWVNGVAVNPLQWLYTDFTSLGNAQE